MQKRVPHCIIVWFKPKFWVKGFLWLFYRRLKIFNPRLYWLFQKCNHPKDYTPDNVRRKPCSCPDHWSIFILIIWIYLPKCISQLGIRFFLRSFLVNFHHFCKFREINNFVSIFIEIDHHLSDFFCTERYIKARVLRIHFNRPDLITDGKMVRNSCIL